MVLPNERDHEALKYYTKKFLIERCNAEVYDISQHDNIDNKNWEKIAGNRSATVKIIGAKYGDVLTIPHVESEREAFTIDYKTSSK